MSIEALIAVAPPPEKPFEAFDGRWDLFEQEFNLVLPQDYKDFARIYGGGKFIDFFTILVPVSRNPYVRLEYGFWNMQKWTAFTEPDSRLPAFWPEPGGLVHFGSTDNGDDFFWNPSGAPDQWSVVIWNLRDGQSEAFDCGMTDFLAGILSGDLKSHSVMNLEELFEGDPLPPPHDRFVPYEPSPDDPTDADLASA